MYGGVPVGKTPKHGISAVLIALIISVILLIGTIVFAVWAYAGMQDYKLNAQEKIDKAVAIAEEKTATAKDAEFVEKEKIPNKTYTAPATAGDLKIVYPKTWSAYVTQNDTGSDIVNGYFHPDYVPAPNSGTDFALRVQVVSRSYDQVLQQYESKARSGKLVISPYRPAKVPNSPLGVRIDGEINTGQQDTMIVLPIRDKTIMVSTESQQFIPDFEKIILENLTYSP